MSLWLLVSGLSVAVDIEPNVIRKLPMVARMFPNIFKSSISNPSANATDKALVKAMISHLSSLLMSVNNGMAETPLI